MILIVGLGNPDSKFKYTRHNIGYMVIEKLAKELLPVYQSEKAWKEEKKFATLICRIGNDLILVKPQTFMNRSGLAIAKIINYYKVSPNNLWVIHDDIDLPIGKIRIRVGGGSAGHNGIESIIKELNFADFVRFRLGIGRGKLDRYHSMDTNISRQEVEKFVLSPFRDREAGEVKKLIKNCVEAMKQGLTKGIEKTMNRYN